MATSPLEVTAETELRLATRQPRVSENSCMDGLVKGPGLKGSYWCLGFWFQGEGHGWELLSHGGGLFLQLAGRRQGRM